MSNSSRNAVPSLPELTYYFFFNKYITECEHSETDSIYTVVWQCIFHGAAFNLKKKGDGHVTTIIKNFQKKIEFF